jgi:hypothetical protein
MGEEVSAAAQFDPDKFMAQRQSAPAFDPDKFMADRTQQAAPNVTPGASDDDIIKSFGYDPAVIKSSPRYQQMVKQYGSGVSFLLSNPGEYPLLHVPVLREAGDVGQGAGDIFTGIVQLARHGAGKLGMLPDSDVQYGDLLDRVQNQDYLQNVRGGQAHPALRLLGNLLMPIPGPEFQAGEKALTTVGKAAVHGAESGAVQPVLEGAPDDYASEKTKQVGTGAAAGAAIGTVIRAGQGGLSRLRAMRETPLPAQAAGAQASRLEAGMKETPWGSLNDVEEAAGSGDRHAQQVLDQVQKAGEDPGRIMQASINLQNYRSGQTANELYNRVGEIADQNQLGNVPVTGTLDALREAENASKIGLKDPALNGSLKKIRDAIAPKVKPPEAIPPPSNIQDFAAWKQSQQPTVTPADTSYGTMRTVISQLDEMIRAGRTGDGALLSDRATGQLQRVKNALEDDVTGFVKTSKVPELQQAQDTADQFYRTQRVPFKDVNIGKAATTDETDQIFQKFMQAGKGDRAQKFYDALDPKGQAAVQYQLVARGINQATDAVKGFDPGKFAQYMDKLKDSTGVFFQGADKKALDGLTNLMVHDAQVNQAPEKYLGGPVTRTVARLALDIPHSVPGVGGMIPNTAQLSRWLLTTERGQRFLYSASRMKPGSGAMRMLGAQIARGATARGGTALPATPPATEAQQDQNPVAAQR